MTREKTSRKVILDTNCWPSGLQFEFAHFTTGSARPGSAWLGLTRPGSASLGLARPGSASLGPASASLGLGLLLACTRVEVACLLGLASACPISLGIRGQGEPGAGINFINDKTIIRRMITLVSGPAAQKPS